MSLGIFSGVSLPNARDTNLSRILSLSRIWFNSICFQMPHHSPSAKKSKSTLRILLFPYDSMSQKFLTMQHFILTFLYSILFSTLTAYVSWFIITHTSLVLLLLTQCYLYSVHQISSQYCHNFIWLSVLITQEFLMVKENVFKHNSVWSAHILLHKSTYLTTFNLWYYSLTNSVI